MPYVGRNWGGFVESPSITTNSPPGRSARCQLHSAPSGSGNVQSKWRLTTTSTLAAFW
jgi:hypothetical protein